MCLYANKNCNQNYKTDHLPTDSQECSILKKKINKYIDMTEYSIKPFYQRYFNEVDLHRSDKQKKEEKKISMSALDGNLSKHSTTSTQITSREGNSKIRLEMAVESNELNFEIFYDEETIQNVAILNSNLL